MKRAVNTSIMCLAYFRRVCFYGQRSNERYTENSKRQRL